VPDDLAAKLGCIALRSKAKDREEFLLYPDQGRRLDDESRAKLEREGTRNVDVQLILSDGLAAWAVTESGAELLAALQRELAAVGLKTGRPLFVKYGRIGVQDEIGVVLGAKATVIFVGERPGLGTGDSGSLYTAYAPRLGQDNAEKDCISNIRALGIPPDEAAKEAADILRRSFAAGGGGTHLVRSGL
jgi:ethanolamine ammonia-lyase small subunit